MSQITADYGLIAIAGANARTFLQGQLTCDMNLVSEQKASFTGYCNQKGRLLMFGLILEWQQTFYIWLPTELIPEILSELNKYARLSKVLVNDVSYTLRTRLLFEENMPQQPLLTQNCHSDHANIYLIQPNVVLQVSQAAEPVIETIIDWHLLAIKNFMPEIFAETIGLFTPQELNLADIGAVSLTKGCYRGQEIIARMHYLGKIKVALKQVILTSKQLPKPGSSITDNSGHQYGTVISAAYEKTQVLLLAVIQLDAMAKELLIDNQPIKVN